MTDFLALDLFTDNQPESLGSSKLMIIPGIQGAEGQIGLQGPPGIQGLQGIQGAEGKIGATGPPGIKGDTGDKGDTGAIGPRGAKGVPGISGDKGDTGAQGLPGKDGKQGDAGPAGPRGLPGPVGTSFNSSNFSLIDDITVTYSNKYTAITSASISVVSKSSNAVIILSGSGGHLPMITDDGKKLVTSNTVSSIAKPTTSSLGQYNYYHQNFSQQGSQQGNQQVISSTTTYHPASLNFRILVNGIPSAINSCGTLAIDGRWNISYTSPITLIRDVSTTIILEWMITSGTAYCSAFSDRSTSHINMILLW